MIQKIKNWISIHPRKSKFILFLIVFIAITIIGLVVFQILTSSKQSGLPTSNNGIVEIIEDIKKENAAVSAGKKLSNGNCEGEGEVQLTHLPMDEEDFLVLIPYGLMIGGHVTPIDHMYFSPAQYNSPRDAYEVYAMADGIITEISARPRENPNDPTDKFEEYRFVFSHTCTFLTYFDLATELSGEVKERYEKVKDSGGYAGNMDLEDRL